MRKIKAYGLILKHRTERSFYEATNKRYIILLHYQIRNWGDAINPVIASFLVSNSKSIISADIDAENIVNKAGLRIKHFLGVGSILKHANRNSIVWGSGLQSPCRPKEVPLQIRAVRGPLTAAVLENYGIRCPRIFGDPALLLPRFFNPKVDKKYQLGIIPHVADMKSSLIQKFNNIPSVKVINMRTKGIKLIRTVLECENLISTSLHGLILGDAYGLPTGWLKVSDKIAGSDFKFHDYHASIGCNLTDPISIDYNTSIRTIKKQCVARDLNLDLNALIESCPYNENDL